MHEIGMCESVVAAVEQRAAGRPVQRVGVRAGALLRVVPDAFGQAFEMVAAGSVAEGAQPVVTIVPVACSCPQCGTEFESDEGVPACPDCGNVRVDRDGGDDLVLEWVQYRDEARPTTGGA